MRPLRELGPRIRGLFARRTFSDIEAKEIGWIKKAERAQDDGREGLAAQARTVSRKHRIARLEFELEMLKVEATLERLEEVLLNKEGKEVFLGSPIQNF